MFWKNSFKELRDYPQLITIHFSFLYIRQKLQWRIEYSQLYICSWEPWGTEDPKWGKVHAVPFPDLLYTVCRRKVSTRNSNIEKKSSKTLNIWHVPLDGRRKQYQKKKNTVYRQIVPMIKESLNSNVPMEQIWI